MKTYNGCGKKKHAIARVFFKIKKNKIKINNLNVNEYFNKKLNYKLIFDAIKLTNSKNLDIKISVKGGGKSSQIFAIRNGIAKALLCYNKKYKKILSDNKLLTRDSRMVERKKIGKIKSRKSKQFSKR
ncbi:30S ribosomal protein S9 [Candidatus Nasuia deltocephalinicola]|uniref:30S ribosomal protein S9 n=1 Tax=Candidatus Nasuia deltocephalincola TaxID=1160784 RepID=UPI00216AB95F|nr:30S ribosomal protein S9 [Candidatus Nasuia deltocephalinicola]